jgi:Ca-activated chloride channel family protein
MLRAVLVVVIVAVSAVFAFSQTNRARPSGTPVLKGGGASQKTPAPVSTKAPTEEEDVVLVETNLITTPVSVLDRQGRFIPNLKKKDFKIFEDGVQQSIELFQSSETPFTVYLLIDVSPSTRYKIDEIHYAALTFVNQLRPTDRVMVFAFDQRLKPMTDEPTSDKQKLYSAIYGTNFGSGTSIYDAVDWVTNSAMLQETGRKALVLFTDGVDTTSRRATFESSVAGVEEIDALIYTIRYNTLEGGAPITKPADIDQKTWDNLPMQYKLALVRPRSTPNFGGRGSSPAEHEKGKQYLAALSQYSGGRAFDAVDLKNIEAAFAGVAEELRRQYSVGYYSNKEGQPGDRKQIKIQVVRPGSVVRAKTTYVVKDKPVREPPTISAK